jgi:hypothetical protein
MIGRNDYAVRTKQRFICDLNALARHEPATIGNIDVAAEVNGRWIIE